MLYISLYEILRLIKKHDNYFRIIILAVISSEIILKSIFCNFVDADSLSLSSKEKNQRMTQLLFSENRNYWERKDQ